MHAAVPHKGVVSSKKEQRESGEQILDSSMAAGGALELIASLRDFEVATHAIDAIIACPSLTRLRLNRPDYYTCFGGITKPLSCSGLDKLHSLHLGLMPSLMVSPPSPSSLTISRLYNFQAGFLK